MHSEHRSPSIQWASYQWICYVVLQALFFPGTESYNWLKERQDKHWYCVLPTHQSVSPLCVSVSLSTPLLSLRYWSQNIIPRLLQDEAVRLPVILSRAAKLQNCLNSSALPWLDSSCWTAWQSPPDSCTQILCKELISEVTEPHMASKTTRHNTELDINWNSDLGPTGFG